MSSIRRWILPVFTVVMGMQLLRVFIPSLAWYLRDTIGLSSVALAPYAGGTFLLGFLAAPLRRLLGTRRAVQLTAGGLAAARLLEQLSVNPQVDLWLSIAGMAMFLNFLPHYLGYLRASPNPTSALWGFGVPLGLAVDIALHGASGTLDLTWIAGPIPIAVVAILAGVTLWSARSLEPADGNSETSGPGALPLLAIGPFILLQLLIFQSYGWVEQVAGLGPPAAGSAGRAAAAGLPAAVPALPAAVLGLPLGFGIVMFGNLALILGVRQGIRMANRRTSWLALAATVYLTLAISYASTPGLPFVVTVILTQLVLGWGWGRISQGTAPAVAPGLGRTGVVLPLGTLLFLALAFIYYVALDVALPFSRASLLPVAALLYGLLIVAASRAAAPSRQGQTADIERPVASDRAAAPPDRASLPIWTAAGLLLVPWIAWWVHGPMPEPEAGSAPVRIMTYNIHSGFGAAGRHDPEAIAQVIEASGADIVALQEVSRVRLLDGGTDLAGWLARRLDFPIVFRGTEEPIWGNAILSRFPIRRWGSAELPREGALIGRGYIWAEIDLGFPLLVINAHLHHVEEDNHIRLVEVPVLLDFWAQRPTTILLGDLNAEPHYPEMALPAAAGLIDSWEQAGAGDGFTWSAADPEKRIDWIWHSPDLQASQAEVIHSLASDHLPVIAEINLAP